MPAAETGRFRRIFQEERRSFHSLVKLVAAGIVKNPLDDKVRKEFSQASKNQFNWFINKNLDKEVSGDVIQIAESIVADNEEEALRERFRTTLDLVKKSA